MSSVFKVSTFIKANQRLISLLLLGFALRVLFAFWGSKFYFGEITFTFGDSFSYTRSVINLVENGLYSFDPSNPDAALYRGPVYPFFWGVHYLIFGEEIAYKAVAFSQCILDTLSGLLIYLISQRLGYSIRVSLLGTLLYLFYPTLLVHVPITGTETFAIFLTLLTVYTAVTAQGYWGFFIVGLLCGLALMTRQYLGLLLPIVTFYWLLNKDFHLKKRARLAAVITIGFLFAVSPWFVRNWVNHNVPTILMGKTSGYSVYGSDYIAFKRFYTLYLVDITPVLTKVSLYGSDGLAHEEELRYITREIQMANRLAYNCGESFANWRQIRTKQPLGDTQFCNEQVIEAYNWLYERALQDNGTKRLIEVPLLNIQKAFFKTSLTQPLGGFKDVIVSVMFGYRTLIMLLGVLSVFFLVQMRVSAFLFLPVGIIFYISFVVRQVEIRYLAQGEAVLAIFAAITTAAIVNRILRIFGKAE